MDAGQQQGEVRPLAGSGPQSISYGQQLQAFAHRHAITLAGTLAGVQATLASAWQVELTDGRAMTNYLSDLGCLSHLSRTCPRRAFGQSGTHGGGAASEC